MSPLKRMPGQKRFLQYLQVIRKPEREEWLFAHLGGVSDEIDELKKQVAQLKRRITKLEKK